MHLAQPFFLQGTKKSIFKKSFFKKDMSEDVEKENVQELVLVTLKRGLRKS